MSEVEVIGTNGWGKIVFEFSVETNDDGNGATFSNDDGMFIHTDFEPKILVDGIEASLARLAELAAAEREGCEYVQQDEDSDEWDCSKCGNAFVLISENPYVNDMFYCPKCGRPIKSINTLTFDWSNDDGECRIEKIITREEYASALAGKGETND